MATIVEHGHLFTITENAATILEGRNKIYKCDHRHVDMLEIDFPIYHTNPIVGILNIYSLICDAEAEAESRSMNREAISNSPLYDD